MLSERELLIAIAIFVHTIKFAKFSSGKQPRVKLDATTVEDVDCCAVYMVELIDHFFVEPRVTFPLFSSSTTLETKAVRTLSRL